MGTRFRIKQAKLVMSLLFQVQIRQIQNYKFLLTSFFYPIENVNKCDQIRLKSGFGTKKKWKIGPIATFEFDLTLFVNVFN